MGLRQIDRKLFGVGINDADYPISIKIQGNRIICPFYRVWSDMLRRCYDSKFIARHPSYRDCTVTEEWLTFSNFKAWMEIQDWNGKHLDKDLCGDGKTYNKENCVFIGQDLNKFLTLRSNLRSDNLLGVRFDKRSCKFYAQASVQGKRIHLGSFTCKEDAHFCYLAHKRDQTEDFIIKESDRKIILGLQKLKQLLDSYLEAKEVFTDIRN